MMENIRNFVIIAHIDHGKSTLADRMLEMAGSVEKRKMRAQYLDSMELEREKGITIKMQPVRIIWRDPSDQQNKEYILNLIDTPGHVDFGYEVSRSLSSVEGAILLVDAAQGIQAQTLANYKLARDEGLKIIPVMNKIDLPNAKVEEIEKEISDLCDILPENILKISAKTGEGIDKIFKKIIEEIPAPKLLSNTGEGGASDDFKAIVFDSIYDNHKGAVAFVRVMSGEINSGDKIYLFASKTASEATEIGFFQPEFKKASTLSNGQIGYIATGIKEPEKLRVGDTIFKSNNGKIPEGAIPLPGYADPKPMVFASVYPTQENDFELLKKSLDKLKLNDWALFYSPESFASLGRGFSMGFLGMLHLEIIKERLAREYNLETILTTPSVGFKVKLKNDKMKDVFRASDLPKTEEISEILEPWVNLEILSPQDYFGTIMKMADAHRLLFKESEQLGNLIIVRFEAPLMEIIADFYDKLKSATSGFASMNYDFVEFRRGDLIRLNFLIAGEEFPAFSRIIPKIRAEREGRRIVEKLKEVLPRQNFAVAIQAAIEGKIIARETIPAMKKDVTGHLYGGDITRKKKLWKKQKEGKKRMRERGTISIPSRVYMDILRRD